MLLHNKLLNMNLMNFKILLYIIISKNKEYINAKSENIHHSNNMLVSNFNIIILFKTL
jgi:hypothetical protein